MAAGVRGHSDPPIQKPSAPAEVLAPGWKPLEFEAPVPGTYRLPPLGRAADGAVVDADDRPARLHDYFGDKVVVLSFIYTHCSDVNGCPLATAVLRGVKKRMEADPTLAGRLRLISLSFDPQQDLPAVMRAYGERLMGGPVEWQFLTTRSPALLDPILESYGQSVVKEYDAGGKFLGSFSHILRVFLIDRELHVRNVYTVSFLHQDTLINDVKTLLMEETGSLRRASSGDASTRAAQPSLHGPGDYKHGYESPGYVTKSRHLPGRKGRAMNLMALIEQPPLGLPPVPMPADNPATPEKIALGRKLFFDRRLSQNNTFSCAMCHIPEQGFTSNELQTAVGIEGRTVRRNSPTLYNVAYFGRLFHDAREFRLEQQIWGPMLARNEMGNPSVGIVIDKIDRLPDYDGLFEAAFDGKGPSMETIGAAIASYERSLLSADSPFDRWRFAGREDALDDDARRGFRLFNGKAGCAACHSLQSEYALFTDDRLHNTGIGYRASMHAEPTTQNLQLAPGVELKVERAAFAAAAERPPSELGRYEVTKDPEDRWKYKTPSLRNVALTAPYMHDGSLATLREVVDFYNSGGVPNELLDPLIRPLELSTSEAEDLVAFLKSLTGSNVNALISDAFAAPVGDADEADAGQRGTAPTN
ncbi:MAG TPA: cytochrome c peroxidase [Gammaproteobacteria bacterium]|nr:cytochrome c peroxidase [Gammaproteobacteria bacterium]